MKNEEQIILKALEKELEKHDLTFDEYMLLKAIKEFKNNSNSVDSLKEKGFIKHLEIESHDIVNDVEKKVKEFLKDNHDMNEQNVDAFVFTNYFIRSTF